MWKFLGKQSSWKISFDTNFGERPNICFNWKFLRDNIYMKRCLILGKKFLIYVTATKWKFSNCLSFVSNLIIENFMTLSQIERTTLMVEWEIILIEKKYFSCKITSTWISIKNPKNFPRTSSALKIIFHHKFLILLQLLTNSHILTQKIIYFFNLANF